MAEQDDPTTPNVSPDRETTDLGRCLVTGGVGFLGRHLAFELIRLGHRVRVFDRVPIDYHHDGLDFVQGDVREPGDCQKACEGIDTVFHTAAVLDFSSRGTDEQRERSFGVNVRGVANLVAAARRAGVKRLVHTSSNNVTLDGPVIDGDETWPYPTHIRDLYTETKVLGEKAALAANDPAGLMTCAIRPGGIYGPGEKMMLARVVDELARGRYAATIGDGSALSDNTYIDNLVAGQIEAARHLVPGGRLGGEAYFITDGSPINYFEFFRPIVEGLGFEQPKRRVPGWIMLAVAIVWEWLHHHLRFPAPVLTPLEVRKIIVPHFSRIDKAKRDFGWVPKVGTDEAMEKVVAYCRELLEEKRHSKRKNL